MSTRVSGARRSDTLSTWQRLQVAAIAWLGWLAIWLINWTVRSQVVGGERLQHLRQAGQPVILSFWHNQIFSATFHFRFQGIVVMTSSHFDGAYIAAIVRRFGFGTARGSSSRGAARALLELKRHLASGRDVAFTIDGPRGPVYRVKPGPLWLARHSGAPILPFQIEPRRFWQLGNWDRFRVPRPFTRTLVVFGNLIEPPAGTNDEDWMERYQQEMDRIQVEATRWREGGRLSGK